MAGTTTPFQWIFDNAVDIQVNHRNIVAQTIARDQTIRASTRGGKVWRFIVTPNPGLTWSGSKDDILAVQTADKFTTETVNTAIIGNVTAGNVTVICTEMPDYKIIPYDRVEWTGTFTFVQSLL